MAYDYPVAHEGTQIKFLICPWAGSHLPDVPYHSIYCSLCDALIVANRWPALIKHENDHLRRLGATRHGDGADPDDLELIRVTAIAKMGLAKAEGSVQVVYLGSDMPATTLFF